MSKIDSLEEQMRRQTLQQERMPDGSSLSDVKDEESVAAHCEDIGQYDYKENKTITSAAAKARLILVFVIGIATIVIGIISLATSKLDSDDYGHSPAAVQDSNVSNNNGITAKTESDNVIDGTLTFRYMNLISGNEYTARIWFVDKEKIGLVDKERGFPVTVDGEQLVFEKNFVAEDESGFEEIPFVIDTEKIEAKQCNIVLGLYDSEGAPVVVPSETGDVLTFHKDETETPSDYAYSLRIKMISGLLYFFFLIGLAVTLFGIFKLSVSFKLQDEDERIGTRLKAILWIIAGIFGMLMRTAVMYVASLTA